MVNEPEGDLTVAYTRYVLDLANSKSLLHLRVATYPCLLGYGEIANRLLAEGSGLKREGNPYLYWIEEYGGEMFQEVPDAHFRLSLHSAARTGGSNRSRPARATRTDRERLAKATQGADRRLLQGALVSPSL